MVPDIFQHMQRPAATCMMIISSDIKCHGALHFCSWCLITFSGVCWSLYQHPDRRITPQSLLGFYIHAQFFQLVIDVQKIIFIYFEKKFQPSLIRIFSIFFLKRTLKLRSFFMHDNRNIFVKLSVSKLLLWEGRGEKWRGIFKLNWCISKCW